MADLPALLCQRVRTVQCRDVSPQATRIEAPVELLAHFRQEQWCHIHWSTALATTRDSPIGTLFSRSTVDCVGPSVFVQSNGRWHVVIGSVLEAILPSSTRISASPATMWSHIKRNRQRHIKHEAHVVASGEWGGAMWVAIRCGLLHVLQCPCWKNTSHTICSFYWWPCRIPVSGLSHGCHHGKTQ